jgi:RNA polymerase sigma factor (sigma-70 family)
MSGSNGAADDRDDAAAAGSSGGQRDVERLAREWASQAECDQGDRLFEAVVLAAQAELLRSARAMANRLVGPADADDVINGVLSKLWSRQKLRGTSGPAERPSGFDPAQGSFAAYFYTAVRNACIDHLRQRQARPQADAHAPAAELLPDAANVEDEVLTQLDHLEEKIVAAVEVLPLSDKHRGMLRMLLGTAEDDRAAGGGPSAQRQARRRLRHEVDKLANLTAEERRAASLVRRYRTVAAAAEAEPRLDVRGLYASATRKVCTLFGLTERA